MISACSLIAKINFVFLKMISTNKKIIVAMLTVALLSSSLSYGTVFAEKIEEKENGIRVQRTATVAVGTGGAVDSEGQGYRSHFKLLVNQIVSDAEDKSDDGRFSIQKGKISIIDDGKTTYNIIPDTWTVRISDDKNEFKAEGKVTDDAESQYSVIVRGEKIRDINHGVMYYVTGELIGESQNLELYYVSAIIHRTPHFRTDVITDRLSFG